MTTTSETLIPATAIATEKVADKREQRGDGIHRSRSLMNFAFSMTLRKNRLPNQLVAMEGALFAKVTLKLPIFPGYNPANTDKRTEDSEAYIAVVQSKRLLWSYKGKPTAQPMTVYVPSELMERSCRFIEERPAFPDPSAMGISEEESYVEVKSYLREETYFEKRAVNEGGKLVEKRFEKKRLIGVAPGGMYVTAQIDSGLPTQMKATFLCTRRAGYYEAYAVKPKDDVVKPQGPFQFEHGGQLFDALYLAKLSLRILEGMTVEQREAHLTDATKDVKDAFHRFIAPLERAKGVKFSTWTSSERNEIYTKNFQRLPLLEKAEVAIRKWHDKYVAEKATALKVTEGKK